MKAYTGFARVYDNFMDDIPYDSWVAYIQSLLQEYHIFEGLLLELGCGTGNVTRRLAALGYDMIGVDNSIDMLELAIEKQIGVEDEILYLLQQMQSFELYGTVAAVLCVCDSLNYLTSEVELLETFRLVNNYLDPGGIFIFDVKTEYFFREILGDSTMVEHKEDSSLIWENFYDEEESINEYDMTIYFQDPKLTVHEKEECFYRKAKEVHYQKAYSLDQLIETLKKAGLRFLSAYDAFTREAPHKESERIYMVAMECNKVQLDGGK